MRSQPCRPGLHSSRRRSTSPADSAQVRPCAPAPPPVHRHEGLCTATLACAQSRRRSTPSRPLVQPFGRLVRDGSDAESSQVRHRSERRGTSPGVGAHARPCAPSRRPVHRHLGLCTATLARSKSRRLMQGHVGLCAVASACAAVGRLLHVRVVRRVQRACTGPSGGAQLPAAVHTSGPVLRRVGLFTTTLACAPPPWPVRSRVGNVHRHDRLCSRRAACARSGRRPSSQVLHRSEGRCTTPGVGATRPGLCTVTSACAPTADLVQRHCGLWDGGVGCVQADGLCSGGWFAGGRLGREGELGGEEGAGLD